MVVLDLWCQNYINMTTKQIKNDFNRTAERLGSRARISGNAKKIILQECIGVDSKGYEIVVKINDVRFSALTNSYPELVDF
jgi:hypothetical protein